jgi:hypothetical protein
MKLYLLDSAPIAAYLHGRETVVDLVTPWIIRREVATSILVYAEITDKPLVISPSHNVHYP